jgi:hypothetical protein
MKPDVGSKANQKLQLDQLKKIRDYSTHQASPHSKLTRANCGMDHPMEDQ